MTFSNPIFKVIEPDAQALPAISAITRL